MTTANTESKAELSKKEFKQIFWRSWTIYGSFNSERMEALGFLYSILPSLQRIWKDNPEKYKEFVVHSILRRRAPARFST